MSNKRVEMREIEASAISKNDLSQGKPFNITVIKHANSAEK